MPLRKKSSAFVTAATAFFLAANLFATPGSCDTTSSAGSESKKPFGVVNATAVNIRKDPNIKSPITGNIARKGAVVRIFSRASGWSKIEYYSLVGWINDRFITECNGKWVVNATRVNVRKGPGLEYPVVQRITDKGTVVELVQSTNSWHQVRSGGVEGWVSKEFISYCESAAYIPAEKPVKIEKTQTEVGATVSLPKHEARLKDQGDAAEKLKPAASPEDAAAPVARKEQGASVEIATQAALDQAQERSKFNIKLGVGYSYVNETKRATFQGNSTELSVAHSFYPVLRMSYFLKNDLAVEAGFNYEVYKWNLSRTLSDNASHMRGYTFVIGAKQYWDNHPIPYIQKSRLFAQCGVGYQILDMDLDNYVRDYEPAFGGQAAIGLEKNKFEFRIGINYFKHDAGNVSNNFAVNSENDNINLSGPFFDVTYNFFGY